MDVGSVATPVAGVLRDAFAELGFDGGNERVLGRQWEAREGEVGCGEAAG